MRYGIVILLLLTCLTSLAWAEDSHENESADEHTHMMGKVLSVEKDRLTIKTEKGEKTVKLGESSSDSWHQRGHFARPTYKIGDDVTVHGERLKGGKFQAHALYLGKCGDGECKHKDLAWSHMHEMTQDGHKIGQGMMKEGRKMGHDMMGKHEHMKGKH